MAGELDRAMAPFDISAAQYVILSTMASGRADTASQLCKEISYSSSGMTRMLDRLEHKGMIRRLRDVDDRRSVKLELSDKCKLLIPALLCTATTVIDTFFLAYDPAELRQLEALLKKCPGSANFLNSGMPR